MVRFLKLAGLIFLLLRAPVLATGDTQLKAGAAKVEITPSVGYQLWGQASRVGPSTGVLDPLYARIIVLKSQTTSLAIVALDLGRTFGTDQMNDVRARVKEKAGIQHVIFCASHTHSAPTILDKQYIEPGSTRWEPGVLDAIGNAIIQADASAVPSHLGTGKGASYIGHNRQDPVGTRSLGPNETRLATMPIDPIVQVLRIDSLDGKPIAVVVNYATHPVVVGAENLTKYSADFPGAMCGYVEKHLEASPMAMFLQGACGDINPIYTRAGRREIERVGQELGREVVKVAEGIRTRSEEIAELQVLEDRMKFRARWNLEKLRELQAVPTYHQWLTTGRPTGYPLEVLEAQVTTVLVNRHIALLTMPGEPYVEHQINFRNRLQAIDTFLAGYSNGYFGYIPTIRAAVRDGVVYGANAWPTILEVGAGERIIDKGIINIYRMLGRLKNERSGAESDQLRRSR